MAKRLYLDDLRECPDDFDACARNFVDARNEVYDNGCPEFISFDHDLGEEMTGYDFAKLLVLLDLDSIDNGGQFIPDNFSFVVHSANPVGKKNIEAYLNNYLEFREKSIDMQRDV